MWQDWVIAAAQWVFVAALIPTLIHKEHKPAFSTCVVTAVAMTVLVYTYSTLGLWQAVIGGSAGTLSWYVLLYQRWRLNKKEHAH